MKPTVLPRKEAARSASRAWAACRSLLGSSTRIVMAFVLCALAPLSPIRSCLRRCAIDAGANGRRHGLGLASHPRRDDGTESAGGTARGDDEQMIGRLQRGMNPVGAITHNRPLADGGPIAAAHAGALIEEFADVPFRPARSLN